MESGSDGKRMTHKGLIAAGLVALALLAGCSRSVSENAPDKVWPGEKLFVENCAGCHGGSSPKAPPPYILGKMLPDVILDALNTGVMKNMAAGLSPQERRQVVEYLTETDLAHYTPPPPPLACEGAAQDFDLTKPPAQASWGYDNRRFFPTNVSGLTKEDTLGSRSSEPERRSPVDTIPTQRLGDRSSTVIEETHPETPPERSP